MFACLAAERSGAEQEETNEANLSASSSAIHFCRNICLPGVWENYPSCLAPFVLMESESEVRRIIISWEES